MEDIILSIKDKYVQEILNKNKKFEFRGWIWKKDVRYVYIYSSGKVRKIVARFSVDKIMKDTPKIIWNTYQKSSGVNEKEYFEYVQMFQYNTIYAIEISNLKILNDDFYINLDKIKISTAPQRFKYLSSIEKKCIERYFSE